MQSCMLQKVKNTWELDSDFVVRLHNTSPNYRHDNIVRHSVSQNHWGLPSDWDFLFANAALFKTKPIKNVQNYLSYTSQYFFLQ